MTFALLTNSTASDRLRARRSSSFRSAGANTTRLKFMQILHHKLLYESRTYCTRLAIAETGTSPEKVAVVPFGANLVTSPSDQEVEVMIRDRGIDPCRLLFIGVEWERKGGSEALELLSALHGRGINAQLDVVGCEPSVPEDLMPFIRRNGYVDRSKPEGHSLFKCLLARSHFLLLFSKAGASVFSLCEAN